MAEYDKIAKYYDIVFEHTFPYEAEALALHQLFQPRGIKSVLDISCGTGSHLAHLAGLGYRCSGSDISAGMLEAAKKKASSKSLDIDFFTSDMTRLETRRTFDAVISLYGFQLMMSGGSGEPGEIREKLQRALAAVHRTLNRGGILIFNLINPDSPLPFPGFGPWSEANIQGVERDGVQIALMNKIQRNRDIMNFKDIYLIRENQRLTMEILNYSIWLIDLEELRAILSASGFRVERVYSPLGQLGEFGEESLDMTVAAVREP